MEIEQVAEVAQIPVDYRDTFDDLIEDLNEAQLDELAEEIKNQKLLLKVKSERRTKMKKEIKAEKQKLQREMRESSAKAKKPIKEESESEEEDVPKKKSKKNK